jgi:hypothetical protein
MELNKTTIDQTPYIGIDTNGDNIVDTIPVVVNSSLPAGTNNIGEVSLAADTILEIDGPIEIEKMSQYPKNSSPWIETVTSSANTAATATVAAVVGKYHYCLGYLVVLRAASAANDALVTIKDGETVKITDVIGLGASSGKRIGIVSALPILRGTVNTDITLNVSAAGASTITELTIWGYTL